MPKAEAIAITQRCNNLSQQLQLIQCPKHPQHPEIALLNHPFSLLFPTDNVLLKRGEVLISSDTGIWLDLPLL